ncbi:signal peptidase I [Enterococcus sp. AZ194]|uniref:signal peptidase I n=1 Tax=Enterococcus sp. AZ194 TaxID=2774629 RepID=UPI003F273375
MKQACRWGAGLLVFILLISGLKNCYSRYLLHSVSGTSMEPSLVDGAQVLIDKQEPITRYSVIGFSVEGEKNLFVKRVIGLPGDRLFVSGTRLVINLDTESPFNTTYSVELTESVATDWQALTEIPEDCYFVLGDHLAVSKDSRTFGWVQKGEIEGSIRFINN